MTREQRIEAAARAMAAAMGDDFDELPTSKHDWTVNGGKFGGRYRDCNEPMRADYIAMAEDGLTAAFPELMSDPPTGWVAPWNATETIRDTIWGAVIPLPEDSQEAAEIDVWADARDAHTKEQT